MAPVLQVALGDSDGASRATGTAARASAVAGRWQAVAIMRRVPA